MSLLNRLESEFGGAWLADEHDPYIHQFGDDDEPGWCVVDRMDVHGYIDVEFTWGKLEVQCMARDHEDVIRVMRSIEAAAEAFNAKWGALWRSRT